MEFYPFLPVYFVAIIDSPCVGFYWFLSTKNGSFWRDIWYVKPGEDSLFLVCVYQTVFLDSRYGKEASSQVLYAPWSGYLLGRVKYLIGTPSDGPSSIFKQLKTTVSHRRRDKNAWFSPALLIGVTFSFGWTPCVGPVWALFVYVSFWGRWCRQGASWCWPIRLGSAFLLLALA